MKTLKLRLEQLLNGVTTTNRETGDKTMAYNTGATLTEIKQFIQDKIGDAEPSNYYDIEITVTKQRNKKPV